MTVSDRARRRLAAALVVVASFGAYWLTHGTGPYWQDAGLFHAGLRAGGGLAPPGYPVYLMLGRPFVWLFGALFPARTFAEAVNTFSAVWAALAAGLTTLAVFQVLTPGYQFFRAAPERRDAPLSPAALLAGTVGGLLAGLSYSLWFQALTAEAYALNAFFAALILYLLLVLGAEGPLGRAPTGRQRRLVILLFVAHGVSCGNHPSTAVFLPVLALLAWRQRAALRDWRLVASVVLAYGASGLLPYLYLLWTAHAHPDTLFSNLTGLQEFSGHVSGSQWTTHSQSYGWSSARFRAFPVQLWQELFAVGLGALVLGARRIARQTPGLGKFLLALAIPGWLVPITYLQGGEYDFWFMPLYLALFLVAGVGLAPCLEWAAGRPWRRAFGAALILAALAPPLAVNVPLVDRRRDFVPLDFAHNLFRHLAPDSLLFASSDQECALSYYLQVVDGVRPDVIRIDAPSLELPWYLPYLRRRYPALRLPPPAATAGQRLTSEDWLLTILAANRDRVAYISRRPSRQLDPPLRWIPSGGMWKVGPGEPGNVDPRDWEYVYRNPSPFDAPARNHSPRRGSAAGGPAEVAREPYTVQVKQFHMQAWKNLGDWQMARADYAAAVAAYTRIFELDATLDHPGVLFALGKALFAVNRDGEALPYLTRAGDALAGPPRAEARLYEGQIHARQGRPERAGACFAEVRAVAPELWSAHAPALAAQGYLPKEEPER